MKTIFFRILVILISPVALSQQVHESIWFATADDHLSPASVATLDKICSLARENDLLRVEISGNTDNVGSTSFNEKLAARRVKSAADYLAQCGVSLELFSTEAFGERKPFADNKEAEGRLQNRRVDLVVSYRPKASAEEGNISDLYSQLATTPNEFCIDPTRDTVLMGREAGVIEIKANSFDLNADNGDNCVRILFRENFTYSSMLRNNLSTLSNGKILESDGMVDIAAFDWKGRPLKLKQGKEMVILVPTEKKLDNILFFDGQHGPNGNLNWNPIANPLANLSGLDSKNLKDCITSFESRTGCARCGIFCRIGRIDKGIKAWTDAQQKQDNKTFRNCQKRFRGRNRRTRDNFPGCANVDSLFQLYGVNTIAALNDTLRKVKLKEIENALENGTANLDELGYYAFSKSSLGLANCDRFSDYSKSRLTTMKFDQARGRDTDIKVAFENEKVIIPVNGEENGKATLANVPRGKKVWVIALKIVGGV